MVAVRIEAFKGMIPRVSDRLLADQYASEAANIKALSGELRPIRIPKELANFNPSTVKRVYRIDEGSGTDDTYLQADDEHARFIKSPISNDVWRRYYWSGWDVLTDYLQYNTYDRVILGSAPWYLGVEAPTSSLTVVPVDTTSPPLEDRTYTYTLVTEYGEEGPPATPSALVNGSTTAAWNLSGFDTVAVPNRNYTEKKIYRSVTGASGITNFHYIATIPLAQATYADTTSNADAALNETLVTASWEPPPIGLRSLQMLPGNFACAFKGNTIYFSEINFPHAWPPDYQLAFENDIVNIVVFANSIAVLTDSYPIILTGSRPESMTPMEVPELAPCLSALGAVEMMGGVVFPSTNGLKHLTPKGMQTLTEGMITKEEWLESYSPQTIQAARYQRTYFAIPTSGDGYFIDFEATPYNIVWIRNLNDDLYEDSSDVNIQNDWTTGEVLILSGNKVFNWDTNISPVYSYFWQTKEFFVDKPRNFGAAIVQARKETTQLTFTGLIEPWLTSPADSTDRVLPKLRFYAYTDGDTEPRWKRDIKPDEAFKLPSKFKSDTWRFAVEGNLDVYSIAIAETGQELENV